MMMGSESIILDDRESRKRQLVDPSSSSYHQYKHGRMESVQDVRQMNPHMLVRQMNESDAVHTRQAGEKRSRRGCQMCKKRRKKCPEDFKLRSDGVYGCSVCFQKGLDCQPPSPSEGPANQKDRSSSVSTHSLNVKQTSPSTSKLSQPPKVTSSVRSVDGNFTSLSGGQASNASQFPTILPAQQHLLFPHAVGSLNSANSIIQPSWTAAGGNPNQPLANPLQTNNDTQDSAWLNNFFQEFSNLSDPIYQDAVWLANQSINAHDAPSNIPVSSNIAESISNTLQTPSHHTSPFPNSASTTASFLTNATSTSMNKPDTQIGRAEYDRIVESNELEALLERYSPLYEKVWRAAMSISEKDAGLMKEILAISRSSKACRAASVAACLSLHHIMQKEKDAARRSGRMGFVHMLDMDSGDNKDIASPSISSTTSSKARKRNGSEGYTTTAGATIRSTEEENSSWPTAEERVCLASKWYQFAFEEYGRSGKQDMMEQRLATLLNLRYTVIALSGARVGLACIDEVRNLISELGVNTDYMRISMFKGTILGVMIQSVLVIDVFEAATKRHQRSALRISSNKISTPSSTVDPNSTDIASLTALYGDVLARDLQKGPLYEYEFTSCLSCDLLEGMLLICNLDADIHEGKIVTESEKKNRIDEVENMIRQARLIRKNTIDGTALVRSWAVHEMWRQAFLIKFYQRILKLGALASKVQKALQEILSLADMLSSTLTPSETWDMWMVWFLASTVSITEEQRSKCILYLEAMGSEQAIIDNLVVIKQLWKASDETGYPQDWYSIAEANGLRVCYAF